MANLMKVFFAGVEDFARMMKEHSEETSGQTAAERELIKKVEVLTSRVEKLINVLENKAGKEVEVSPVKSKRMMDIKKRIRRIIEQHPEGIRPPQIARILGTKVQNLYPHLKAEVQNNSIHKDSSGVYFPIKGKPANSKKSK